MEDETENPINETYPVPQILFRPQADAAQIEHAGQVRSAQH